MDNFDLYSLYGKKKNICPIRWGVCVIKRENLEWYIKEKIKFLYWLYEGTFDEDVYNDILWASTKSWKFLEQRMIKHMVDGKVNLEFLRALRMMGYRSSLMIVE